MMPFSKPLADVQESDLQALKDDKRVEDRQLEYKQELPKTPDDKTEFLKDVVAFANSAGGIILYGIEEERDSEGKPTGIPKEVSGLSGINADATILRLENIIRDGIDPRITGFRTAPIGLENGNIVIALEIPRSWNIPHAVNYRRHWRFYYRDSAGKHPMDVSEVRNLFNLSENLTERIRNFRADRLFRIAGDETPVPLKSGAKVILHLIPLDAFTPGKAIDIAANEEAIRALTIEPRSALQHRYNLDGMLNYATGPKATSALDYTQVFRSGVIEAVDATVLSVLSENGAYYIGTPGFERGLIDIVRRYLRGLATLEIATPVLGYITLMDVRGYRLSTPVKRHVSSFAIDRDNLEIPGLFIEDLDVEPADILRPVFDALWNSVGWRRCELYDENGQWIGG
jgi:hypothetical protein